MTISINFLDGAVVSDKKLQEMREHYRALRFCLHEGETAPMAKGDHAKPKCFEPNPRQQQVNGGVITH